MKFLLPLTMFLIVVDSGHALWGGLPRDDVLDKLKELSDKVAVLTADKIEMHDKVDKLTEKVDTLTVENKELRARIDDHDNQKSAHREQGRNDAESPRATARRAAAAAVSSATMARVATDTASSDGMGISITGDKLTQTVSIQGNLDIFINLMLRGNATVIGDVIVDGQSVAAALKRMLALEVTMDLMKKGAFAPTSSPTKTHAPTPVPTRVPTDVPSVVPTTVSKSPTNEPTGEPTREPTREPTPSPTSWTYGK